MNVDVKYVGFWSRTAAALIDSIWLYGLMYLFLYFILGPGVFGLESEYSITQFTFEYIIPLVIVMIFWVAKSATPGKMLFNMKIVDANTLEAVSAPRLLLRYMAYFISMIPLFLGIMWVGWDKKKQGWHDKLARTVVIAK